MDSTRSALIVASYDYDDPGLQRLRAPAKDAEALARVLRNPGIGGFEVQTLLNEPSYTINEAVEGFFTDARRDDLLLLHFSCHGVKDERGELYFAAANTRLRRLGATAVAAEFVSQRMTRSRSRRVVLLLDCCYAGAFERGMVHRASTDVGIGQQLGGHGRAVITASSAMEYAFEGDELAPGREPAPSVFTSALVEGLETGEADRDQDGLVALDELYQFVYDKVQAATPNQTPGKWMFGGQGELVIAWRARPVTTPAPLPGGLQEAVDNPIAIIRKAAVQQLTGLLGRQHAGLALAARQALERLTGDDSRMVAAAATKALSTQPPPAASQQSGELPATLEGVQQPPTALEGVATTHPEAAPEHGPSTLQRDQLSEQELGALWTDAFAAYFQGSWSEAVAALSTLVDRQPNYRSGNAKAKLEDARRQLDLARRYDEACSAQNDGAWPEAIGLFEAIVAVDPEYRDVDVRLEEVRRTEELATLQAYLRRRHQARKWKEVIQLGEQISAAYPEAGDPEGLVASARTELARARRAEKSAQLFSAALKHIDAGAWQEAIEVLERLKREDADYRARDVKGLLARTSQELAKAEEDRRQGQLAELYNAGRVAEDAGQWPTAIECFEAALVVDDEYRDAAARLEHARRQHNLDALRAEAQRLHEARNWEAVLELGVQMRQLDPEGEPDPAVASAQAELAKAEQERESTRRYSTAQTAMEAGELQQALKALEELEQMHPGYRDTALLIDATRRELMNVVINGDERVLSLAFTADNRLALATIRRAQIWDLSRRREMHTLDHSRNFPSALAFSFGAEYLAVGAYDGIVHVWQLADDWTSAALWVGAVVATALSADGQRLAVANGAGIATVWDVASKHKIASFRHTDTVVAVALSPDGTRLATGSQDKTAHVWDIASSTEMLAAPHDRSVLAVALSPDGTRLATGSQDKTAHVWDIASSTEMLAAPHDRSVLAVALSPDGTRLATGSQDKIAGVWDIKSARMIAQVRHNGAVRAVALSPDGTRLATGSDSMTQVLGLKSLMHHT